MIRIFEFDALKPEEILNRDIRAEASVEATVDAIIADVRARGDAALKDYALRTQSATLQQNSPFLLRFPVFAQLFVSHAPVCGGAWRLGGRLVGGMAGLRRTVPVFLRRDGYTAPLQTVCGVCGGGCVFGGLHARQRDAVLPLQRGAGLLQICHSLFCPPCPAPDSRFPLADFYLRQLLKCI